MSEMNERIAKVLEPQAWAALGIGDTLAYANRRTSSLRKARKVIEAMREPTKEMISAFYVENYGSAEEGWYDMIDAALNEKSPATS